MRRKTRRKNNNIEKNAEEKGRVDPLGTTGNKLRSGCLEVAKRQKYARVKSQDFIHVGFLCMYRFGTTGLVEEKTQAFFKNNKRGGKKKGS